MSNRPKPLALKIVQGTARAGSDAAAPAPAVGRPRIPAHLTGDARAAWAHFAEMLGNMGVLTVADGMALERLCAGYAEIRAFERLIEAAGSRSYRPPCTDKSGTPLLDVDGLVILGLARVIPEVSALADADRRFRAWMVEFGLTPAARGKVKVADTLDRLDPAAAYF